MTDITTIPEEELRNDWEYCRNDNALCRMALRLDIVKYSSENVEERIRTNVKIIIAIEAELARREKEPK